jgi:hypothetical protein
MTDEAEKRGRLIRHLEEALALADEMEDGQTGFLVERAPQRDLGGAGFRGDESTPTAKVADRRRPGLATTHTGRRAL